GHALRPIHRTGCRALEGVVEPEQPRPRVFALRAVAEELVQACSDVGDRRQAARTNGTRCPGVARIATVAARPVGTHGVGRTGGVVARARLGGVARASRFAADRERRTEPTQPIAAGPACVGTDVAGFAPIEHSVATPGTTEDER